MANHPGIAVAPSPLQIPSPPQIYDKIGAVGGGILRPGAIDQSQFQKLLQAQYRVQNQGNAAIAPGPTNMTLSDYRKLAGIDVASGAAILGPARPTPLVPGTQTGKALAVPQGDGIPTLSPEQFATLIGSPVPETPPDPFPAAIDSVDPVAPLAAGVVKTAVVGAPKILSEGQETAPAGLADGVSAGGVSAGAPSDEPEAADPRIAWFDTPPDRDERRTLAGQGKTWRLKETPGARELFLGPDGEFGWDDFIDIINPLQHIPVVAQIYRAVTGDQAYGLSTFIGAAPFGPLSLASAVLDTVVRAQTGRDAGTDLAARVLGIDNRTPEEADLHLARGGQDQMASAAAGARNDNAAATQTADASTAQQAAPSSTWTLAGAGRDRD